MATSKKTDDLGASEVQAKKDQEEAQGFVGTEVDPTPNEHYTVSGVVAGKPTPETDEAHADWVADYQRRLRRGEVNPNA